MPEGRAGCLRGILIGHWRPRFVRPYVQRQRVPQIAGDRGLALIARKGNRGGHFRS
jgi:hypothetical protein